jgi:hypothetical protein
MKKPDPRRQISRRSSINVLFGIWLAVSPWLLGYGHGDPRWNDIVLGSLIAGRRWRGPQALTARPI